MKELTFNELSWILVVAAGVIVVILISISSTLSRIAWSLQQIAQDKRPDYSDDLIDLAKAITKPCEDCGAENSRYYSEFSGRYCKECYSRIPVPE